ncbi:hypothetical protein [Desmospora activa]|uniref:Spore germination protein GerPA/GerPF n=1 Tax=Desmospora activa DSM 45169 TaxID=1121389 RepID=A0A2T4Z4W9_9BACL|nr:hypothetical protein [Desmospora activa]PTM56933.1 hypothetical protein C8J48_3262 [Desmospora activa DSM 45169]
MFTNLHVGVIKTNIVTQGGIVGVGINLVQNRNATKQNNGVFTIGDGVSYIPTSTLVNWDPDKADMVNIDANNVGGGQI